MKMIFGTNHRKLMLRRAETAHMPAGAHGISVHKDAPALSGCRLILWKLHGKGLAQFHNIVDVFFKIPHIHTGGISPQGQGFIRIRNLFRPDGQRHVVHPRPDSRAGQMQSRRSARTGILHIGDRDSANPHVPHHHFAADGMLIIEHPPEGIGKEYRLHILFR